MKPKLVLAVIMMVIAVFLVVSSAHAQTTNSLYELVESQWMAGRKEEVLRYANTRLASNTNDMAGLLMKMEYQLTFMDFNLTQTMARVEAIGPTITNTEFVAAWPQLLGAIRCIRESIPVITVTNWPAERAKGALPGKPFGFQAALKAAMKGMTIE